MTFDSSGNLVSPAANVANITFAGLTDGAAAMNMTWDVLGRSGKPTISQVDATSSPPPPRRTATPAAPTRDFPSARTAP